jgi:hypothetical protein
LRDGSTLLLLLGVGVTATVGQLCVTRAFTDGPPARVAVVGLMQIVFALGLDLVFAEPYLSALTLAGIGLVLAPTAWVMVGKARRSAAAAPGPAVVALRLRAHGEFRAAEFPSEPAARCDSLAPEQAGG